MTVGVCDSGDVVWQLSEGRFGCSIPLDMIMDLAEEHGVTVDLHQFQQRLQQFKVPCHLSCFMIIIICLFHCLTSS